MLEVPLRASRISECREVHLQTYEASVPAVEMCSEMSDAGMRISAMLTWG